MAPPDAGSLIDSGAHNTFSANEIGGIDFISPSEGQFFGDVMVAVNYAGNSHPCIAMALINKT
jgi:hypothetical protein